MNVFGGNRSAIVERYLEGPSGIGPRSRRDHGDIGAMHRGLPVFGHERVSEDHALRRGDSARQIGMGEVHAVVRDRDGHALAEIAALVGRMRGDALQSPMFSVLRGPVVLAIRRRGSAQIHRPELESDRVRCGGRPGPDRRGTAISASAAGRQGHKANQEDKASRRETGVRIVSSHRSSVRIGRAGAQRATSSCSRRFPSRTFTTCSRLSNQFAGNAGELPRVSRRLHSLSLREDRADELIDKMRPGNPGSSNAAGAGAPG